MVADPGKKRKIEWESYVHLDLIREIFVRLPCKSLIRFKAACKLFGSLVHNPRFIREHGDVNTKPSHYLTWEQTKLHIFSLNKDEYSHIIGIETEIYRMAMPSSHGLVCLHGWDSKSVALFNPTSEQVKFLPDLPRPFAVKTRNQYGAPGSITWHNNYLGFGFDLKSQKYKVIQFITRRRDRAVVKCYVLTVDVGSSWRRIHVYDEPRIFLPWQPIYANGVLYYEMPPLLKDRYVEAFVFDLSTEKMNVIQSPVKYRFDQYGGGKHLTSLEGNLCCVDFIPPTFEKPLTMTIWKLNGIDWTLWYKLEICSSVSSQPGYWSLYPLYVDSNGRIICEGLANLYCYNIHTKSLEIYPVTKEVGCVAYSPYNNRSLVHTETLLSLVTPVNL